MKTLRTLCMGCMTDKGTAAVCPRCGFVESDRPASPAHLPPRTLLQARYVVGRVLGEGGFGITYLGWDDTLEMRVAIKEFLPRYLAARGGDGVTVSAYPALAREFAYGLAQFLDEARRLARFVEQPGIVAVRDFFTAHQTGYLVMNYLEGMTLGEHLERCGGRLPFARILSLLAPVLDALRQVHAAGLLHRDISPDNLFLPDGKPAKLIDFGAARAALGERSGSLSVIVKPGYAPEEQYRSRGQQGPWTDIYALGATFYHALTGEHPPPAPDRIYQDLLLPPSALGAVLPRAAESILLKALAVRAEQRFQTVADFQTALEWATEGVGVAERAPAAEPLVSATPPTPVAVEVSARSVKTLDRRWLIVGLVGFLFAGGTIGSLWWYHGVSQTASSSSLPPVELSSRDAVINTPSPESSHLLSVSESSTSSMPPKADTSPRIGPSFDCRKAKNETDKIVCDSSKLSILDLQLSNAYREVIARTPAKKRAVLVASQNTWLQKIRGSCQSETCLIAEYTKRIRDLESRYR